MLQFDEYNDTTPKTAWDTASMVEVLEGRHGMHAAGIAEFFAAYHGIGGRKDRARSWLKVASLVRQREDQRLTA